MIVAISFALGQLLCFIPSFAYACGFGSSISGGLCRGYLTSTTTASWTVPSDWNSSNNSIECVGPGGNGTVGTGAVSPYDSAGGQGGGYGKVTNVSLTANSSITIQIGAGGSTNATYLQNNSSTTICQGDYGANAVTATGGNRSQTNIGAAATYSGGAGGSANFGTGGPGGGGAAGPLGAGGAGGTNNGSSAVGLGGGGASGGSSVATDATTGGNNSNATGGGVAGTPGSNGTAQSPYGGAGGGGGEQDYDSTANNNGGAGAIGDEWDATHGAGGGGGGGGDTATDNNTSYTSGAGGSGGLYGGGGAGAGYNQVVSGTGTVTSGSAGQGAQGIIVITYTPAHAALSLDGSANASNSTTLVLTTTQPNDIIVVHEFNESDALGTEDTVSNITDTYGLHWTERSATTSPDMIQYAGSVAGVDNEVWWALATSPLSSDTITVNLSGTTDCESEVAFGVNGANISNPWDSNTSLPPKAISVSGVSTPSVSGISTTNANAMIFGFMGTGAWGSGTDSGMAGFTPSSGYTIIDQNVQASCTLAASAADEYQIVSSAQSNISAGLGANIGAGEGWFMVGDAIQAAGSGGGGSSGRIIRLIGGLRLIGGIIFQ